MLILAVALAAVACEKADQPTRVGADRDEHGCIASAGYTFSTLKNGCIRLWEEGISLLPATPVEGALLAAYVIWADTQAELFLPSNEKPLLLTPQSVGEESVLVATDGTGWKLVKDLAGWKLYQNNVLLYSSEQPVH